MFGKLFGKKEAPKAAPKVDPIEAAHKLVVLRCDAHRHAGQEILR